MSKKPTPSRLKNLFNGLEQKDVPSPDDKKAAILPNWAWEVDTNGHFVQCGPDVEAGLGHPAAEWIGQSIYHFGIAGQSLPVLQNAIRRGIFPVEVDLEYQDFQKNAVLIRSTIFMRYDEQGQFSGWRGFSQVISRTAKAAPRHTGSLTRDHLPPTGPLQSVLKGGIAYQNGKISQANVPWTEAAATSLAHNETITQFSQTANAAAMVIPFQSGSQSKGLIEILDENVNRHWSEDDLMLAQDVARQLALALENAELYAAVQLELSERARAEKETLKRNQELSLLNQVGQQFNKLTSRQELLNLIQKSIGELVDHRNLTIALYNPATQMVSFSIHTVNAEKVSLPDASLDQDVVGYLLAEKEPLLLSENAAASLQKLGITIPDPTPLSLLGIPMLAGERPVGAIVVQDFEHEKAYTNVDAELLSTIATQATTALENANLFQEITNALQTLETRERYQANIAKSVATLTQFGTLALPDVLNTIAIASRNTRIFYATVGEDEQGPFWQAVSEWHDPGFNHTDEAVQLQPLLISKFPHWASELRSKGWSSGTVSDMPAPERDYLKAHKLSSILLLSVPGKNTFPNFLAFEQHDQERKWGAEEINVLRVAADALSNTIVREDLLEQLQVSLDETENLYNTSHRLALANDLQEMVAAITLGMNTPNINRGVLVLFEYDPQGKTKRIYVAANWYSETGTPPLAVGLEYPRAVYEHLFYTQTSSFIDDIFDTPIDASLRDILAQQNIRSIAILPLWASKYQLGVLLLESEVKHQFSGRETRSYPPLIDQMATAIENQRLFEQTQAALAETGLLYQISSGIAQANNPEALIKLVANQMLLPKNADRATLFMAAGQTSDGAITEYEIVGDYNPRGTSSIGIKIAAAELPVFKTANEVITINNLLKSDLDPISKQTFSQHNIQSICLIPLRTAGKAVGFLATTSTRSVEFGADEVRILQVASGGFAVALERYRLLNEAQRRALELQTAAEIARDTTGTLAIDELLSRIVNLLGERFKLYHAAIYLLDEGAKFAVVHEASGDAGQELKRRGHKLAVGSRSIIGSTTSTGATLAIPDISQSALYFAHPLLPNTQSEIGIPLKAGNRVVGALDLQYDRINAFGPDDVSVLQILADQIAVAIENAKAYELARKAYEEIKEVDRVKSQFLANMSHELRTPLNSIIGFSRVILKGIDGPINETQKQDLSAIYNSGQHLLTLINNILDLSKIEAGKMELQISEVSLADLVNSVMSTVTGLVKDKPIRFYQQIPADLPLVKADQTRVRQILLNFVSNAAKFTEEGSITVAGSVVANPKGKKEVMVTITDTGNGIALEDQGKLFQPFSQVDDSPTRKTGGTGLGLSICRSMVEMHGGRIGLLHSEVGKGSTFFFTLPLVQEEVVVEEPQQSLNVILAIDDDAQVISLYERYLKPQGYQVVALTNPHEAVERAKEIKPYAITLDIMMPELDGWQVLQKLKNDPDTRDIPIVICSILEDAEKGYNLGAADYLVKPFLQEDLINTINRVNKNGQVHQILVIDDDAKDARLVQKMLEESGKFQVTVADGGKNGWDAMVLKRPDVVILDLFMPDLDGFTLLGNMRADPQLADLPVIVLTGADLTAEQHAQMTQLGQQFLSKGLLRERELLNTLDIALRKIKG